MLKFLSGQELKRILMSSLKKKEKEKFDYIISLGGNCSAGLQLKKRKLRTCSFPFDWFLLYTIDNFYKMLKEFKNDFANSFKAENLVEMKDKGTNKYDYNDPVSGYNFVHIFMHDKTDIANLKKDEEKIKRRLKRFYSTVDKKVAFILSLKFDVEDKYLDELKDIINSKWKNAKIYIILYNTQDDSERTADNLTVWRLRREENLYDYFETNWIWHFLDNFEVEEYKKTLFGQILYKKIYKGIKIRLFPKLSNIFCLQFMIFGLRFVMSIGKEKTVFREV